MSLKLKKFLEQPLNKFWSISDVPGIGDKVREQLYDANLTKAFQLYEIFKSHQTYESFNQIMMREHQVSLRKSTFNAFCMVREKYENDSKEPIEANSMMVEVEIDDADDDILWLDNKAVSFQLSKNAVKEQLQQLNNEAVFTMKEEPLKNELHSIPKTKTCLQQKRINKMNRLFGESVTRKSGPSTKQVRFNNGIVRKPISHHKSTMRPNTSAHTAPTTTVKYSNFMDEPLGDNDIQSIPGIGSITANSLIQWNITKAYQLFGLYLYMGKDDQKFTNFMTKCFVKKHLILKCIEALHVKCNDI